jgi:superfamily II DNA or RNA helicase
LNKIRVSKKERSDSLFIVDNSDADWKVGRYLHEWCEIARSMDVATGFFEISSLLFLDGQWQKLEDIRILMGDEVSKQTKQAFVAAIERVTSVLNTSIEREKETNDFLIGVPAVVEALRTGKVTCRVYRKKKFHAKTYITHGKLDIIGSVALVGSSNFTLPGITQNVELNIQIQREVNLLQDWFEQHWREAEDVTPEILKTVERHTHEYSPFEVYAKALQEFFRGHQMTSSEWEQTHSRMYPVLDQYQKDGYQNFMKICQQYGGAFLCDAVGLGKTFIGLMAIERLVMHERKRVALFVPKTARKSVWERDLRRYLRHIGGLGGGDFSNLVIFNHTDFGRGGDFPYRLERIKELADVIMIDEAHHFRNPGIKGTGERRPSRYRQLLDLINGTNGSKQIFLITATPVNNQLDDFRHMVELFTSQQDDYFASTLGIHSLRGHFIRMDRDLRESIETAEGDGTLTTNLAEAERVLLNNDLFRATVVQRSRAYVKKSQLQQGEAITSFPSREPPKVVNYSIKKTYGRLLEIVERAFAKEKALFALSIYYPLAYYKGSDETIDPFVENRQKQVVGLIRTQFLKRFESSAYAFERSCGRLFLKLLTWVTKHSVTGGEKQRLDRWKSQHDRLIEYLHSPHFELLDEEEEADEDIITEEMLEDVEELSRDEYKVEEILADTYLDLDQVVEFLNELRKFKPHNDDKLKALKRLLKSDEVLKKHKLIIFTEFAETARYLHAQLQEEGLESVDQIDSGTKREHGDIIEQFAPYYNDSSSTQLVAEGKKEIRVLISTDMLSEGLNLQDAARLINYDIHWNPVRLMQRVGRVDRRMNPEIEDKIESDHPDQQPLRGKIIYWNFLPPDELNDLLRLYERVSNKTLRISKTFGIEGKKLLRPEDDYDALHEFNQAYEGTTTNIEGMLLEYQNLLKNQPDLAARLDSLPGRVFTGKKHPTQGEKALFFCYRLPRPDHSVPPTEGGPPWTEEAGETKWYLYNLSNEAILEEPDHIIHTIRSSPDTPRHCTIGKETLSEIRIKIEKRIKNTYLKKLQAPIGVRPILKAWMELS